MGAVASLWLIRLRCDTCFEGARRLGRRLGPSAARPAAAAALPWRRPATLSRRFQGLAVFARRGNRTSSAAATLTHAGFFVAGAKGSVPQVLAPRVQATVPSPCPQWACAPRQDADRGKG